MKRRKLKKSALIGIIIILIIIGIGGYFAITKLFSGDTTNNKGKEKEPPIVKKLNIFDEESKTRPIAVMINNNHAAWPHAGLQKSYLNYEIVAEGGITRIMALYKDVKDVEKIGSVRSSRPYYLDYVLENDAIYVHWGGSDQAYSDIRSLGLDHIDGMTYEGKYFFRDKTGGRAYEHTGFTKMSMIEEGIDNLQIQKTTEKGTVFNYSVDEIDISEKEGAIKADDILIDYSYYHNTSYKYDETRKVYLRSMSDKAHVDAVTNEQYTAKNIITYQVRNKSIDSYGRQKLENVGSGEGYYITNGYAVPITWEKSSRSGKTIYKYKDGIEIKLNDGNTWVQIQPVDEDLEITGIENNDEVE
ncbi:MAG: DUF3048 domain-containing protein [Bacilli bacterium]|nr:DUF3048 domain-containing protein [Bacilli bacterium]